MKNSIQQLNSVKNYAAELKTRISFLEQKLEDLPEERLTYLKVNNRVNYYYRSKGSNKSIYLSKKNDAQITALANKYYINHVLPKLKKNLCAAESFIALHSEIEERDFFGSMPDDLQIRNGNLFLYKPAFISKWQSRPYKRNTYKIEEAVHDTLRGEKVRSKSEAMIANAIHNHNLAYLIEFPLRLGSLKTIYPDFTILNPNTLEAVYWEHFGMMDNVEYANAALKRIQVFAGEGVYLGKNLICTFESSSVPLSSAVIESYIQEFLLR